MYELPPFVLIILLSNMVSIISINRKTRHKPPVHTRQTGSPSTSSGQATSWHNPLKMQNILSEARSFQKMSGPLVFCKILQTCYHYGI